MTTFEFILLHTNAAILLAAVAYATWPTYKKWIGIK